MFTVIWRRTGKKEDEEEEAEEEEDEKKEEKKRRGSSRRRNKTRYKVCDSIKCVINNNIKTILKLSRYVLNNETSDIKSRANQSRTICEKHFKIRARV